MAKKAGAVPQLNNAVGKASLGQIPGSSFQPPGTPSRILGKDASNQLSQGVGALGTGSAGLYGPSPTQAMLSGPTRSPDYGASVGQAQGVGGNPQQRMQNMGQLAFAQNPGSPNYSQLASSQQGLPQGGGQFGGMRYGAKSPMNVPGYGSQPVNAQALTQQMRSGQGPTQMVR